MNWKTAAITILLSWVNLSTLHAEPIHLSAAASMTDAVKELIGEFSRTSPETKFITNFASSGAIAKQIDQGAPADLIISANSTWLQFLVDKDLIEPDSARILAYNALVFVGRAGGEPLSLADLTGLERIALGTPESVAAGQYARQALEGSGVYATLRRDNKLILAQNVRQALLYAERGEVDGAFVFQTDALLARQAVILFVVPDQFHDRIAYPAALTRAGSGKTGAQSFYQFLTTSKAIAVLRKFGFTPAD